MLSASAARRRLADVCAEVGLDATGQRLLGPVGDNAVFLLPRDAVVVRIASQRRAAEIRHQLEVARWLEQQGFPAARVRRDVSQPLERSGTVITFWEEVLQPVAGSTVDMAQLLRRLHRLPAPNGLLETFDPFAGLEGYISRAVGISATDRGFLHDHLSHLRALYADVEFVLPPAVIHGDAHRKNIVRDRDGRVHLLDLDHLSMGAREWDLVVAAVYQRVGWYSDSEYAQFARAYGFDVTSWPGFPVLSAIRRLRMTSWLAARSDREPSVVPEVVNRIESLRQPSARREWTPGT